MKKLFLLFAALIIVLTACEQPTTEQPTTESPPPTEGYIDGKAWRIIEGTLTDDNNVDRPALIYRMDGEDSKEYDFWVAKLSTGDYWMSVKVKNPTTFADTDYDKLLFKGSFNIYFANKDDPTKPIGTVGEDDGSYYYDIRGRFLPEQFADLTNEGDLPVELSKSGTIKDSFVVSKNFPKLLKTFF